MLGDATLGDAQTAAQALHSATVTAGRAPSIGNTQPWQWRLHGDTFDLSVDRHRVLELSDPDGRLAILSCGVALHHALVSLSADGWHTTVSRLPDSSDPDHLATVRADSRIPVDPGALRQFRAIELRHTDRHPISGIQIDADKLRSLVAVAESHATALRLLRPGQVVDMARAADLAWHTEGDSTAWQAELHHWTGGTRPLHTGLPDVVIPHGITPGRRPSRDFGLHSDMLIAETHDRTSVLAILSRPGDRPLDWLGAGEALSAVWLTATDLHVAVLPLSATIEVPATREILRHMLGEGGYPMLVLRLSVLNPGAAAAPHTPRLRHDQTVTRTTT
jgi:hypothetical protein